MLNTSGEKANTYYIRTCVRTYIYISFYFYLPILDFMCKEYHKCTYVRTKNDIGQKWQVAKEGINGC